MGGQMTQLHSQRESLKTLCNTRADGRRAARSCMIMSSLRAMRSAHHARRGMIRGPTPPARAPVDL
eukprot:11214392-Lingulodinium_polyedra.AAC.1